MRRALIFAGLSATSLLVACSGTESLSPQANPLATSSSASVADSVQLASLDRELQIAERWARDGTIADKKKLQNHIAQLERDVARVRVRREARMAAGSQGAIDKPIEWANTEEQIPYVINRNPDATYTIINATDRTVTTSTRSNLHPLTFVWAGIVGNISTSTGVSFIPTGGPVWTKSKVMGAPAAMDFWYQTSEPLISESQFSCSQTGGSAQANTSHQMTGSWTFFSADVDTWVTNHADNCGTWSQATISAPGVMRLGSLAEVSSNCAPANQIWQSSSNRVVFLNLLGPGSTPGGTPAGYAHRAIARELGDAVVFVDCPAERKRRASTTISVVEEPEEPCGPLDEFRTEMMGVSRAGGTMASNSDTTVTPCGPGGNGGGENPPPDPVEPNGCIWVRYIKIYIDGTTEWIGNWEWVCPEMALRGDTKRVVELDFVAVDAHKSRAAVEIVKRGSRRLEVTIDTGRAGVGDVIRALRRVRSVAAFDAKLAPGHFNGEVIARSRSSLRNAANAEVLQAATLMDALSSGDSFVSARGQRGRRLRYVLESDGTLTQKDRSPRAR